MAVASARTSRTLQKPRKEAAAKPMTRNEKQEAIRECLSRLASVSGGKLTPDAVIEEARNPDSPLHGEFEWNIEKAAYRHWVERAREIIRTVKYEVKTVKRSYSVPLYARNPEEEAADQGYAEAPRLLSLSEVDVAARFLSQEIGRVVAAAERACAYAAAGGFDIERKALERTITSLSKFVT